MAGIIKPELSPRCVCSSVFPSISRSAFKNPDVDCNRFPVGHSCLTRRSVTLQFVTPCRTSVICSTQSSWDPIYPRSSGRIQGLMGRHMKKGRRATKTYGKYTRTLVPATLMVPFVVWPLDRAALHTFLGTATTNIEIPKLPWNKTFRPPSA